LRQLVGLRRRRRGLGDLRDFGSCSERRLLVDARIILLQRIFNQSLFNHLCSLPLPLLETGRDASNSTFRFRRIDRGDILCLDNWFNYLRRCLLF
jgi:hypothetical protein